VTPEYINPTSGTCQHVLNMAARKGDVALATDAFRVLHKHHAFASLDHYEMLFEAQINAGDIEGGLKLLCEMHADNHSPDHASTRPLFTWLMDNPSVNPADYFDKVLAKFEVQGLAVPAAAANVLIEACAAQHRDRWADGFRMYERIREVCAGGADATTFRHMFDLCRAVRSASWPHRLAAEHAAAALPADAVVLDGVVAAELHAGAAPDRALARRDAAARAGVRPLRRTLAAVYAALRAARHPRAGEVGAELFAALPPAGARRAREAGDRAEEAGRAPSPWEEAEAEAFASVYPPDRVADMDGFFHEVKDKVLEEMPGRRGGFASQPVWRERGGRMHRRAESRGGIEVIIIDRNGRCIDRWDDRRRWYLTQSTVPFVFCLVVIAVAASRRPPPAAAPMPAPASAAPVPAPALVVPAALGAAAPAVLAVRLVVLLLLLDHVDDLVRHAKVFDLSAGERRESIGREGRTLLPRT
jgi:pentatricopeptide repeat protein